jgi:hypothetical protein
MAKLQERFRFEIRIRADREYAYTNNIGNCIRAMNYREHTFKQICKIAFLMRFKKHYDANHNLFIYQFGIDNNLIAIYEDVRMANFQPLTKLELIEIPKLFN